jgi:hypothetical protein
VPCPRWYHEARYHICFIPLPRAARSFFVTAACPFARRRAVWPHARPVRGLMKDCAACVDSSVLTFAASPSYAALQCCMPVIAAKFPAPSFCFLSLFTCNLNGRSVPPRTKLQGELAICQGRVSTSNGILVSRARSRLLARALSQSLSLLQLSPVLSGSPP